MGIEIKLLKKGDEAVLANVASDVFDDPLDARATELFLADVRHHIVVAIADGRVVGFASAVDYVHPDKPHPDLWINEVGVSPEWQGKGAGAALVEALLAHARRLGCAEAWVTTEASNAPARQLYASTGGKEALEQVVMFTYRLLPDPLGREAE